MAVRHRPDTVTGFFIRALLALALALGLWYALRSVAVWPLSVVTETAMRLAFGSWVTGTELNEGTQVLLTNLQLRDAAGRVGDLAPEANLLAYGYGLPLLAALLVAVRARGLWWKLPVGALALLPVQAFGVCSHWLVQVAVGAGAQTRLRTGFDVFDTNLIGACYQLGFLILPTLAPVLVWLAMDRRLVVAVLVEGTLSGSLDGGGNRH